MRRQLTANRINVRQQDPLLIGTILDDHYIVVAELARTQMTHVYLARMRRSRRLVVIKRLSLAAEPAGLNRLLAISYLLRESDLLLALRHRAIPQHRDCFRIDNDYYLVMDHVIGTPLNILIAHQNIGREPAINLIIRLCNVVLYLHERDNPIIHADIKPGNIIVTPSGDVVLLDLGLARPMFPPRSTHHPVGTIPYAPPEQIVGNPLDKRTDIYALGSVLRELVPVSESDDELEAIIERATALVPGNRYKDVQSFVAALEATIRHQGVSTTAVHTLFWWLWGIVSVVILLGVLSLPVLHRPGPQTVPITPTPALQLLPPIEHQP
jgi:serine/threonine protein kinase